MEKLTDRQRMTLVFDHKAPDRAPIIDEPWDGTISRWKREGMPGNTDYRDFFGIDKKFAFGVDNSPQYERIAALLRQYGCEHHCYMMSTSDKCLAEFHDVAPDIERCVGWDGEEHDMRRMVDRAVKLGVKKIQLFKPFFNQDTVDYAHANGIRCNIFWADDPREACRYIDMGMDTVLTNDYLQVSNAIKKHQK